ncbi:MAG: hypothetical protein KC708_20515 [Anaerolineae bacterium]|nr:hypothetical protein [Anaerolineae bacterium]
MSLLTAIAEIAGVFVGFGALISVTRRSEIDAAQLGLVRAVVTIGLEVLVAALIPVGLSRYGFAGHDLWLLSSLVFLAIIWVVLILSLRNAENRQLAIQRTHSDPVMAAFFWVLLEIPMQAPLVLVILGINPSLDPAFYITALVLNLFQAAFVLAQFVYSQAAEPAQNRNESATG